ncbi:MAG: HAMP domain-containing sensor histidine kinase [Candidatus Saccharimonadaceae bacterium]|nr:HAMP domain-containing sensor histidine kinase [Candidatus Saccharimonadaceae bacterium]
MKREKLEIIYSIIVLVTIPVIVAVNTIILVQTTNDAFNLELNRKADLANGVIAQSSLQLIKDREYDKLQKNLVALESSQPTLMHSMLIVNKNDNFTIVARSQSAIDDSLDLVKKTQVGAVVSNKQSIASLTDTYDRNSNPAQAWNVMSPVLDDGKVIAVISANYLTVDAEKAIDSAYQKSYIVLIISIALIFGLLFRHFRLVGYAQLLAKQKELNQAMSDFLSVATHELKSPTSIIKGYLSNIIDGDFGEIDPKIKEQIQVAITQTERLNSLVQDLLNVSRVEQGRVQYNITEVDTVKILNTVISNYRPIAEEKNIQIVYEPVESVPFIKADENRVQEIFINLIDNAIKYTAKGSVTVSHKVDKNNLITNVRDTGFGMSSSARQRLFQRFYRVKTDQTQNISGTGLGLWIIKQYIEAMGGNIEVESMEDVGSNFIVTLPIKLN